MTLRNLFRRGPSPQSIMDEYAVSVLERIFLRWPNATDAELVDAYQQQSLPKPDPNVLQLDKLKIMLDLLTLIILKAYPCAPLYMAETAARNGVALWRR